MIQTIQKPPPRIADANDILPIVLKLSPLIELTDRQFAEFCGLNRDLHIERTATGELEIMAPAFSETSRRNSEICRQLANWTRQDGTGWAYDSSGGFTLPNGAIREPDASWISRSRLEALTPEQRSGFYHICPDFLVELRSDTDRLSVLRAKMQEYMGQRRPSGLAHRPPEQARVRISPGSRS